MIFTECFLKFLVHRDILRWLLRLKTVYERAAFLMSVIDFLLLDITLSSDYALSFSHYLTLFHRPLSYPNFPLLFVHAQVPFCCPTYWWQCLEVSLCSTWSWPLASFTTVAAFPSGNTSAPYLKVTEGGKRKVEHTEKWINSNSLHKKVRREHKWTGHTNKKLVLREQSRKRWTA